MYLRNKHTSPKTTTMGKLNIAHHKSYHPYRRDNIERVRQDEEEARLQEAKEEGRVMLADSEARIDLLRQRAGLEGKRKEGGKGMEKVNGGNELEVVAPVSVSGLPTTNGHINLFHDVEQSMVAALTATKKTDTKTSQQGVKLAPDEKELQRWYTQQRSQRESQAIDDDDDRSKREVQRKHKHDPLTAIEQQLAARPSSSSMPPPARPKPLQSRSAASSTSSSSNPSVHARLQRESSERERAQALIQRRKKELEGSMTPSTVYNDDDEGYRDVYNRQEVQDAHRGRKHRERRRAPMRAYYYDNVSGDQRLPHDYVPSKSVSNQTLDALNIKYWTIPVDGYKSKIDAIAKERNYKNRDLLTVSKAAMGDIYEEKLKTFFAEHMHEDEEIRYILDGSGFFDVREARSDAWIRLAVEPGDLLVVPSGIYHRFTLDENDYIKALRLFQDEPKWVPHNRNEETDANPYRADYLKTIGVGA